MSGILFGMGNPLLDISDVVSEEMLRKYDLKDNDAILAEEKHMPIYDELAKRNTAIYIPGGATQNAIKVAQWLLKEPNSTVFSGCIKDDKFGKILDESCTSLGVKTAYQYNVGVEPTGLCACLINGVNRSLVTNLGAACKFTIDHLNKPEIWSLIEKAKFYYISGFFITSSHESLIKVAKHSLATNKTFCLNFGAMFLIDFFYEQLSEAMEYSDVIFGNETEALRFSEKSKFNTKNMKEIVMKLLSLPYKSAGKRERMVIITQGSDPIIVGQQGKVWEFPVKQLPISSIVDTNGAGDAFVGGFLSRFVKADSIDTCIQYGVKASQLIIGRSGCTFPETVPADF